MLARRTGVLLLSLALAGLVEFTPASANAPDAQDRAAASAKAGKRHIDLHLWRTETVGKGRFQATRARHGIVIGKSPTTIRYNDPYGKGGARRYDRGRWYSPWRRAGFDFTELIASYRARTPVGTFVEISARGREGRRRSSWDSLGRWASHDKRFHRMSLGSQPDDTSSVAVDTMVAEPGVSYAAWQVRVSLYRRAGAARTPRVSMIGAMASRLPSGSGGTSRPGDGPKVDLDVPRYSQMIHQGEYPRWNGGGEAWCSPTSTSMVLAYWDRGPTPKQYAWVKPQYRQPWVDYAARYTFAWGYGGTGMWPFNTAYAGRFGLDAFVTRLRSLREAEVLVRAGIPVVASIAFGAGDLDGTPIESTDGHLLVIRGFTERGRVIVNDPAAPSAKTVRRIYKRGQLERAWIGATGGVAYVIHPASTPLPAPARHSNW